MQTLIVLVSLLERVLEQVLFLQTMVLITFSLENVQVTKTASDKVIYLLESMQDLLIVVEMQIYS